MKVKSKKTEAKVAPDSKNESQKVLLPAKRRSDEVIKKTKWINRQRVLVLAYRGINLRSRHLMEDLKRLMPHHRPEAKIERQKNLQAINEICEAKNCNKAILFEGRLKRDLFMWFANVPSGPSAKFLVENIHTMGELKLTGNCLRGSRPLLSFDESFSTDIQYGVLKELLTQIFGVPNQHPKSQPFFDHVYTFSILDNRIWFRNFQILTEDGGLVEVGPRFVLNPVKIFSGSFGGQTIWENPHYISPGQYLRSFKEKAGKKYLNRIEQKVALKINKPETTYSLNPLDEIFSGDVDKKAEDLDKLESQPIKKQKVQKVTKKKLKKIDVQ
ncbi:GSCOCG00011128001-RA-CDS [Cotesia congregata]|uniref:Ribosome biogenesis protein BRX1 homolog n=1 Tax=Cotesia congregata TaxID=51543 RepID=A0A8J2ENB6_COTCN|nr:GSCOCG00011128001-RA-CDS [Cotesia congregata]CAG5075340.1 Similar to CG11583: Ribosome biogenesis protein BRX1 homolog (Drosophila melanogaster) [Cotesia congregata]